MKRHTTHNMLVSALGLLLCALSAASVRAQDVVADDAEVLRIDTRLVSVTVQVADAGAVPLQPEQLRVSADGVPQQIAHFDSARGATVALLVDASSSMQGLKAKRTRRAIASFLKAAPPSNRYLLFAFTEKVRPLGEFDGSPSGAKALLRALEQLSYDGNTSLYDACIEVGKVLSSTAAGGKRALLIFTDGTDNNSVASARDLRRDLDLLGGLVYVVVMDARLSVPDPRHAPGGMVDSGYAAAAVSQLRPVMDATTIYHARSDAELIADSQRTAANLADAVQLGFYPQGEAAAPGAHALLVESLAPASRATARTRYYVR